MPPQLAPAGLVRLKAAGTGDERVWVLPVDWQQPPGGRGGDERSVINRIFLARGQDEVLLDIRGVYDTGSYAMTLGRDGASHRFPAGWIALGWLDRDLFLLQGERDGEVAFAVGDSHTGRIRDLYPRREEER